MKKTGILNRELSNILARVGHTDKVMITDCGMPIPESATCVDLSLTLGTPGFLSVLEVVESDLVVEKLTFAEEIKVNNPSVLQGSVKMFDDVSVDYISHERMKKEMQSAKVVIRTGEDTPFANVVLHAGVLF